MPAVTALEHVVLQTFGDLQRLVHRREARHLAPCTGLGEDHVFGPGLDQERSRRDERAEVDVLDLTEHARQHLRPAEVPRHAMGLAPLAEVATHDGGAHPVVPCGQEEGRGAAIREADHADAMRVDEGMLLEHVERAAEIPQILRERVRAGGDSVDEVEIAAVLVGRVPVGTFAEAAQVGREHHVAALGELMRVVAVLRGDRGGALLLAHAADLRLPGAVTVLREDGGAGLRAIVWDEQERRNRHRRLGVEDDRLAPIRSAVDGLAYLEFERDAFGHRPEQRVEAGAAPIAPRGDRARIVGRAWITYDELIEPEHPVGPR